MKARDPLPALTGLRGVAALWVMLFHLPTTSSVVVLRDGYLGVDIFFILSGFILSYVYAAQLSAGHGLAEYAEFLKARLVRIYPLHAISLVAATIIAAVLPGFGALWGDPDARFSAEATVRCAALIQNWGYREPLACNAPSWSLSAEWGAYLVFPLILAVLQPIRSVTLSLRISAVLLGTLVVVLKGLGEPTLDLAGWPGMLRVACEFPCGCLLYQAFAAGYRPPPFGTTVLASVLIGVATTSAGLNGLALFGFAPVILLCASGQGVAARLLARPGFVFLGEISFSLYMFHWIVREVSVWFCAQHGIDDPSAMAAVTALDAVFSLVLAALSYRHLEMPLRQWGRRVVARHAAPATVPSSA